MKKTYLRIKRAAIGLLIAAGMFFGVWFYNDKEEEKGGDDDLPPTSLTSPFVVYTPTNRIIGRPYSTQTKNSLRAVQRVRENARNYVKLIAEEEENAKRKIAADIASEERRQAREDVYKELLERQRLEAIAEAKKREEKKRKAEKYASGNIGEGVGQTYEATYYTARCDGCSGITKTGIDVRNTIYSESGLRVIAVDPSRIPLGSVVEVSTPYGTFKAVAGDIGGGIKGGRVDILVATKDEARSKGRHNVQVRILN